MQRVKVYISGPLSDSGRANRAAQWMNLLVAADTFCKLASRGFAPLCPHLTLLIDAIFPGALTHDEWLEIDVPWLEVADLVLRIPGTSAGADLEVRRAQDCGIPVVYSIEEAIRWRESKR